MTSEVLPAIRKDGGYMVVRAEESDEVIMARALLIMQKALEKRDAEIAILKPRAEYADEVLDSVSCMTVTQIGKELNMTGHDLNVLLCEMRIQYPQSGQYLLYADYARKGYARHFRKQRKPYFVQTIINRWASPSPRTTKHWTRCWMVWMSIRTGNEKSGAEAPLFVFDTT